MEYHTFYVFLCGVHNTIPSATVVRRPGSQTPDARRQDSGVATRVWSYVFSKATRGHVILTNRRRHEVPEIYQRVAIHKYTAKEGRAERRS